MKDSSGSTRPTLPPLDTLDEADFLAGRLSPTGFAELDIHVRGQNAHDGHPERIDSGHGSLIDALSKTRSEPPQDYTSESDDIEDYDDQRLDASAVIEGSRGGERITAGDDDLEDDFAQLTRSPSIPIKLEKLKTRGRYLLTADDPDIQDIIRRGLEREQKITQRNEIRDLVFTRRFTAFDRSDPLREVSPFYGFFTLFWIGTGLMIVRIAALNYRQYGNIFGPNEILRMMFGRDVFVMGATDAFLCASTAFTFILQLLVLKGYLNWNRSGWVIQHIWQTSYLAYAVGWTFYRNWPWTHTIFIVLHSFVFLMKQHSYAAYNGYLSEVYKRKIALEKTARQLDDMSPVSSPVAMKSEHISPLSWLADRPSKTEQTGEVNREQQMPRRRRKASTKPVRSASMPIINLAQESTEIASAAETISSGIPLDSEQMKNIKETISAELDALSAELRGKCSVTDNYYPRNLTLANFIEWTCLPTLVYELEYPRQDHINWSYVAEKTAATFGILGVMQVISQAYIYPLVIETIRMRESGVSVQHRSQEVPWVILDLLFPLMLEYLLSWYLIWECVLNVVAELTCFADRGFYGDWWNSVTFADYARDWNKVSIFKHIYVCTTKLTKQIKPVHNFLLRHVYHSSISAFHLSKSSAMFITFLLSALVHELVMFCLFHKVRGYLFLMQLLQLPLAALSRTRLLRGRKVLGNIVFWFGIFVGPSIITGLYLVV